MGYPHYDYTFEQYSLECERTARTDIESRMVRAALGLTGEAGELMEQFVSAAMIAAKSSAIADMVKKEHFHSKPLDRKKAMKEAGNILWYLNDLAKSLDTTLEEIAKQNIEKLRKRHPVSFTPETAAAKADEKPPASFRTILNPEDYVHSSSGYLDGKTLCGAAVERGSRKSLRVVPRQHTGKNSDHPPVTCPDCLNK